MLKETFTKLVDKYRLSREQQNELSKVTMFIDNDTLVERAAVEIASRPTVLPLNCRPGYYETDRGRKELAR